MRTVPSSSSAGNSGRKSVRAEKGRDSATHVNPLLCRPLFAPQRAPHHSPEVVLDQGLVAIDHLEEQHLLLDVRREQCQLEELRHPRRREADRLGEGCAVSVLPPVELAQQLSGASATIWATRAAWRFGSFFGGDGVIRTTGGGAGR